jgi:hypothetical protein
MQIRQAEGEVQGPPKNFGYKLLRNLMPRNRAVEDVINRWVSASGRCHLIVGRISQIFIKDVLYFKAPYRFPLLGFQRFMLRATLTLRVLFSEDFRKEALTHKITELSGLETIKNPRSKLRGLYPESD